MRGRQRCRLGPGRRERWGGREPYFRGADDIIIFPLQCSTQWDARSHVFLDRKDVQRLSARLCHAAEAHTAKRRHRRSRSTHRAWGPARSARREGVPYLEPGYVITAPTTTCTSCVEIQGVRVGQGDYRARAHWTDCRRERGDWGDLTRRSRRRASDSTAAELGRRPQGGRIATDTWGMEVARTRRRCVPADPHDPHRPHGPVGG